jgi:xanthine dehydrogenase accessory factor
MTSNWLTAVVAQTEPAVLVTVAHVEGSAPRDPGAKMVFTKRSQFDTIGGGHLEMRAWEIALDMLARPDANAGPGRCIVRIPLGPSLGQCCGGIVYLAFERIVPSMHDYFGLMSRCWRERQDSWRIVALDADIPPSLLDRNGNCLDGPALPAALAQFDRTRPCHMTQDNAGRRWLIDPCLAYRPCLVLFGAGHVGTALIRVLGDLPCHVTWVDEREELFPPTLPANVRMEATDTPEVLVDRAPAGASFLVMTHSHALDQCLSERILRRTDTGWFGLIGSNTKRTQFERRLRERGISSERLADMACPIGIPGITGKTPAVIAVAVCAQLLLIWETADQPH